VADDSAWPGMLRPFDDYDSHLDILGLYLASNVALTEAESAILALLVREPWRIASRERSFNNS